METAELQRLTGIARGIATVLGVAGILFAVNQHFNLQFLVGRVVLDNRYLFLIGAVFLPVVFLGYPGWRRARASIPAIDWLLAAAAAGVFIWLATAADRVLLEGWEYAAPETARWIAVAAWMLVIEAARRAGGIAIAVIVFLISLYPTVADAMPGPISGIATPFLDAMAFHVFSTESAFGIPMRAFGELVVGFIVFGVAMNHTGAGRFFTDLAFGLVGRWRGGAAQVAVISSGLQGSISGSVISNVIASGVVTIPAMKRTGFASHTASGVECVASTGGVLMPPVMGSTAFVMASFLGIPYVEVAVAAAIPALLFYFGLVVQIDGYAARQRLGRVAESEIPPVRTTLARGWPFIAVFALLVWAMLRHNQESLAPWYATALMLVINQVLPDRRLGLAQLTGFFADCARALAELVAILLGVGLIVGAFAMTGMAGTLANDLVFLAGDSTLVLLLMGAVTAFIFGMGMTVTACYIFLAITLAPALVRGGLDPLAVHLFIMYWGMVSFITPPVALAAFAAASVGKANPMHTGFEAMRLGSAIYLVPFFFVLNPALILKGDTWEVGLVIATAVIGIVLFGSALQGYLVGFGAMRGNPVGLLARVLLAAGGIAFALPGGELTGFTHAALVIAAVALAGLALLLLRFGGGASRVAAA
ncbi:TRAP transporter fused permease subunit [Elioraea tepidiphila]|uniref:TRAP transporter permease n=1 Tax=Elioraea tepidiphila TaxID=457934 RepID=UPI002FDB1FC9